MEYSICVRRSSGSTGASTSMHEDVALGDLIEVTSPAGVVRLASSKRYLLIAGGIGITMIRSLASEARQTPGAGVHTLYLTRSEEDAPFISEFASDPSAEIHHSRATGRLNLWPYLAVPDDDTHIYVCGPPALVDEVLALTPHWRRSRVHVERFERVDPAMGGRSAFTGAWEPTGQRVNVTAEQSLLSALRLGASRSTPRANPAPAAPVGLLSCPDQSCTATLCSRPRSRPHLSCRACPAGAETARSLPRPQP